MNSKMSDRKLWVERTGYGLGNIGVALIGALITTYLTMYMTNVALLDVAAVSLIMAVSRVFDGISDIVIGNIIDNTRSRFGKARAWLLRMSLPYAVSMFLLFYVPPQWPGAVRYVYVFITYNLVNTVIRTFIQISDYSMVPLMTEDPMEQGLLGNIQSVMMNLGLMCGNVIFVRLLERFTDVPGNQNTQRAYSGAVIVTGLMFIVLTMIMVACNRENVSSGSSKDKKEQAGIKEKLAGLRQVLLDRDWLIMVLCSFLCYIILQTRMTGATYYALYIMGDMGKVAWLTSFNMGASLAAQFITPFLMKRFGMRHVYTAGIVIAAAGIPGFGLTSSVPALSVFLIMGGIGNGLYRAMIPGIFAVLITDIGEKSGRLQAGIGSAGISGSLKLGQGIGSVIFGFSLSLAGFNAALDAQGTAQPPAVNTAISAMYLWLPLVLYIIIFVLFVFFFDRNGRLRKAGE